MYNKVLSNKIEQNEKFNELRRIHGVKQQNIKRVFLEHPISLLMHKGGFLRKDIPSVLGLSSKSYNRWIKDPVKYFTFEHYERLGKFIGVDVDELVSFIRTKKKSKPFWFEV